MKAGLLLVLLGGILMGVSGAGRLRADAAGTRQAISAVNALKREICTRLSPLPEAAAEAQKETESGLLHRFLSELADRGSASGPDCWRAAVETADLSGQAAQILLELAPVIGRYEGEEQRVAFDRAVEQLMILIEEQRERSRIYGRVYIACGVCGGAILAILLG